MAFNYTLLTNYLICFGFGFMFWLFFLKGYLISWFKVKLPFFSKADIQVRVKNPVSDYFVTGSYNNGMLFYTAKSRPDNKEPKRMIAISQEVYNTAVYRSGGIPCIDVDDVKNCVLVWQNDSYSSVEGFNAETMAETVDTALNKPSLTEGMNNKIFQLIVIGGLLIIGVAIYFTIKKVGLVDTHVKMVYDLVKPMYDASNLTAIPTSVMG